MIIIIFLFKINFKSFLFLNKFWFSDKVKEKISPYFDRKIHFLINIYQNNKI